MKSILISILTSFLLLAASLAQAQIVRYEFAGFIFNTTTPDLTYPGDQFVISMTIDYQAAETSFALIPNAFSDVWLALNPGAFGTLTPQQYAGATSVTIFDSTTDQFADRIDFEFSGFKLEAYYPYTYVSNPPGNQTLWDIVGHAPLDQSQLFNFSNVTFTLGGASATGRLTDVSVVPEPSTVALLGVPLLLLVIRRVLRANAQPII